MESGKWDEIKYRDKQHRKYKIIVYELIRRPNGKDGDAIFIDILENDDILARFRIEFSRTWESTISNGDNFYKILRKDSISPLVRNVIMDFIHAKKINDLDDKVISFHTGSEYARKVFRRDDNLLDYRRDPTIIAEENRLVREIALKEMYFLQNEISICSIFDLQTRCHFDERIAENAIKALIHHGYFSEEKYIINMTLNGMLFVENQLLQYFTNKIFLIAACNEDIYEMIDKVYKPAVENEEIGCELVFQERSEPKGAIHDEIWENIERCKLVICDLTGSRPNCFIEYGYALAKDKKIVLCIEESEGKNKEGLMKAPFDTLTQKYSFWKQEWLSENNEKELNKFKDEIKERVRMKINIIDEKSEI